jgi:hypothetical protein
MGVWAGDYRTRVEFAAVRGLIADEVFPNDIPAIIRHAAVADGPEGLVAVGRP